MSAVSAVVVVGAITAASAATGTVIAAKMASNASKDATAANKASTDAALAYAKQQDLYKTSTEANRYSQQQQQTAPYRASGVASNARMADLLGLPAPTSTSPAPPTYPVAPLPGAPAQTGPGTFGPSPYVPIPPTYKGPAPATAQAGDLVMMRAPDGTTKQVPRGELDHWTKLGAQQVG